MGALRYFGVLFLLVSFNATAGHAAPAAGLEPLQGRHHSDHLELLMSSGDEELANATRDRRYRRDRYRRDYRKDCRDRYEDVYKNRTARVVVVLYASNHWHVALSKIKRILDRNFYVRADSQSSPSYDRYKIKWGFDVSWYGPKRYLRRAIHRIEGLDDVIYVTHYDDKRRRH